MVWLFVVCGIVGLLLLCMRFPSMSSWLARPLGLLAMTCRYGAGCCGSACVSLLEWPWHRHSERSLLGLFVARGVYLVMAATLLLGELPRFRLLSGALLQIDLPQLPFKVDLTLYSALLWLLLPLSFCISLCECLEILPTEARLFGILRKWIRICGSVICVLGILTYLVVVFFMAVYGQCVVSKLACADNGPLQVYVSATLLMLLIVAGINGAWAVLLGLAALVSFGFGLLYFVLSFMQLVFALMSDTIHGTRNPWRPAFGGTPFIHVSQPPTTQPALAGSTEYPQLPSGSPLSEMETLMANSTTINTLVCLGNDAHTIAPNMLEIAKDTGMQGTFLAVGTINLRRVETPDKPLPLTEGVNISPTREEINAALADESLQPAYTKLTSDMAEEIVNAYLHKSGGNIVIAVDIALMSLVYPVIRKIKQRLSKQQVLLFIVLPPNDLREHLREEFAAFIKTAEYRKDNKHDHVLALVIDPYAKSAIAHGEAMSFKMAAATILSLCNAGLHDEHNPLLANVIDRMVLYSPFVGFSCCVEKVSPGKISVWSKMARLFDRNAPEIGTGDLADLIHQSRIATDTAITDDMYWATSVEIDTKKPFYALYNIPLTPSDKKRWQEYTSTMERYVKQKYNPTALTIAVRANPPQPPYMKEKFRISATVLYPLPIHEVIPADVIEATIDSVVDADAPEADLTPLTVPEADETSTQAKSNGRRSRVTPVPN